ncbi:hypothetical protein RRG08_056290 [Elysia crispata]|uniref:Uncharacterized protein n=1 Tax=Elysia crispata TaxID=231223 RepID=A0AAE1AWA2_9GAST|nr:hypothetical protein RRG08_056290 [Elysia crispata]
MALSAIARRKLVARSPCSMYVVLSLQCLPSLTDSLAQTVHTLGLRSSPVIWRRVHCTPLIPSIAISSREIAANGPTLIAGLKGRTPSYGD